MAKRYMKRCSISSYYSNTIKTTMRYHCQMTKIKDSDINAGEEVEKVDHHTLLRRK